MCGQEAGSLKSSGDADVLTIIADFETKEREKKGGKQLQTSLAPESPCLAFMHRTNAPDTASTLDAAPRHC